MVVKFRAFITIEPKNGYIVTLWTKLFLGKPLGPRRLHAYFWSMSLSSWLIHETIFNCFLESTVMPNYDPYIPNIWLYMIIYDDIWLYMIIYDYIYDYIWLYIYMIIYDYICLLVESFNDQKHFWLITHQYDQSQCFFSHWTSTFIHNSCDIDISLLIQPSIVWTNPNSSLNQPISGATAAKLLLKIPVQKS